MSGIVERLAIVDYVDSSTARDIVALLRPELDVAHFYLDYSSALDELTSDAFLRGEVESKCPLAMSSSCGSTASSRSSTTELAEGLHDVTAGVRTKSGRNTSQRDSPKILVFGPHVNETEADNIRGSVIGRRGAGGIDFITIKPRELQEFADNPSMEEADKVAVLVRRHLSSWDDSWS